MLIPFVSTQRLTANVNSASTDSFANFSLNNLEYYYFNIAGKRIPQNFVVNCNNEVSNAKNSISTEQAMLLCCSVDNDFSQLNFNQSTDSTSSNAHLNTGIMYIIPSPVQEHSQAVFKQEMGL